MLRGEVIFYSCPKAWILISLSFYPALNICSFHQNPLGIHFGVLKAIGVISICKSNQLIQFCR